MAAARAAARPQPAAGAERPESAGLAAELAAESVALVTYSRQMGRARAAAELRALAQGAEVRRTAAEARALPAGSAAASFLARLEGHQARVRLRWQLKAHYYRWIEERTAGLVRDLHAACQPRRGRARAGGPQGGGEPSGAPEGIVGTSARLHGERQPAGGLLYGLVSTRPQAGGGAPRPLFLPGQHLPTPGGGAAATGRGGGPRASHSACGGGRC